MYANHAFDVDYDPDEDDTPIVCVGGAEGPPRPKHKHTWWSTGVTDWTIVYSGPTYSTQFYAIYLDGIQGMWQDTQWPTLTMKTWLPGDPWSTKGYGLYHISFDEWFGKPTPIECELPEDMPTIKFGQQNWLGLVTASPQDPCWKIAQSHLPNLGEWQEQIKLPETKGDYESLAKKFNDQFNYAGVK